MTTPTNYRNPMPCRACLGATVLSSVLFSSEFWPDMNQLQMDNSKLYTYSWFICYCTVSVKAGSQYDASPLHCVVSSSRILKISCFPRFRPKFRDQTHERNAGKRKDRIRVYSSVLLRCVKRWRTGDATQREVLRHIVNRPLAILIIMLAVSPSHSRCQGGFLATWKQLSYAPGNGDVYYMQSWSRWRWKWDLLSLGPQWCNCMRVAAFHGYNSHMPFHSESMTTLTYKFSDMEHTLLSAYL